MIACMSFMSVHGAHVFHVDHAPEATETPSKIAKGHWETLSRTLSWFVSVTLQKEKERKHNIYIYIYIYIVFSLFFFLKSYGNKSGKSSRKSFPMALRDFARGLSSLRRMIHVKDMSAMYRHEGHARYHMLCFRPQIWIYPVYEYEYKRPTRVRV